MNQTALAVGCIRQAGEDVFLQKLRIVLNYFLMRHPCREPPQHIFNSNPHAANTWSSATFSSLNRDDLSVIHSGGYIPPFRSARTGFFEFFTRYPPSGLPQQNAVHPPGETEIAFVGFAMFVVNLPAGFRVNGGSPFPARAGRSRSPEK